MPMYRIFKTGATATAGVSISTPAYDAPSKTASGKVPVGASVSVAVNGSVVGAATVDGSGNWSYVFGTAPTTGASITALVTLTSGAVIASGSVGVPSNVITFNGDPLTYNADYLTYGA